MRILNRQTAVPIFGQLLLPIISSFASHAVLPLFRFVEEHTTLSDSNLDGAGWALTRLQRQSGWNDAIKGEIFRQITLAVPLQLKAGFFQALKGAAGIQKSRIGYCEGVRCIEGVRRHVPRNVPAAGIFSESNPDIPVFSVLDQISHIGGLVKHQIQFSRKGDTGFRP